MLLGKIPFHILNKALCMEHLETLTPAILEDADGTESSYLHELGREPRNPIPRPAVIKRVAAFARTGEESLTSLTSTILDSGISI